MSNVSTLAKVVAVLFAVVLTSAAANAQAPPPANSGKIVFGTIPEYKDAKTMLCGYVTGQIDTAKNVCQGAGLTIEHTSRGADYVLCTFENEKVLKKALETLAKRGDVIEYVQPNYSTPLSPVEAGNGDAKSDAPRKTCDASSTARPDDPRYKELWGMENICAPAAWSRDISSCVVVAVLDTGVDYTHEDLSVNMYLHNGSNHLEPVDTVPTLPGVCYPGYGCPSYYPRCGFGAYNGGFGMYSGGLGMYNGNGSNGYDAGKVYPNIYGFDYGSGIDPKTGKYKKDFVGLPDPKPLNHPQAYHGSHCAGTIGAAGSNQKGVVGVNWYVKIMPVQIFTIVPNKADPKKSQLRTFTSAQVDGIYYAVNNGARVISASYGGGRYQPSVEKAIKEAAKKGVLFVASAGNENNDNDAKPHFPDGYKVSNIISVAAANRVETLSKFNKAGTLASNFGTKSVDLAAPGGETWKTRSDGILSTVPANLGGGKKYRFLQGTSMACPHVSGAAAFVWGLPEYRHLTPEQLREVLLQNARKVDGLKGKCATGAVLDLSFVLNPCVVCPSCPTPNCLPGLPYCYPLGGGITFGSPY